MNPITKFEAAAHQAFTAKADPMARAKRLHEIALAIGAYVNRSSNVAEQQMDAWKKAFVKRSLEYLKHLQRDVLVMASEAAATQSTRPESIGRGAR